MTDRFEIETLSAAVVSFAADRDWEQFHDPKNLAMALASESGEICAALRWVRNDESDQAVQSEPLRSALLAEIGDVAVLLLLLCQRVGTHLDEVVLNKLAANNLKYPVEISKGQPEVPTP
jgi:dCTP diphosphatase